MNDTPIPHQIGNKPNWMYLLAQCSLRPSMKLLPSKGMNEWLFDEIG